MAHRAWQILEAVKAELVASTAFGDRVYIQRTLSLSEKEQELPAACVFMGPNEPLTGFDNESLNTLDGLLGNQGLQAFDMQLTVPITVVCVAGTEAEVLQRLLELDSAAHVSVMADRTHGLAFVTGTSPRGQPNEPSLNVDGSRVAGSLETRWAVDYSSRASTPD